MDIDTRGVWSPIFVRGRYRGDPCGGHDTGPDGTIHACYKTHKEDKKDEEKKGDLRVVSDDEKCRKNETPISWNQGGAGGAGGFSSYSIQTTDCIKGTDTCTATCPGGHKVLGGGYEHAPGALIPFLQRNGPLGNNAWRVTTSSTQIFGQGLPDGFTGVTIFATCADTN